MNAKLHRDFLRYPYSYKCIGKFSKANFIDKSSNIHKEQKSESEFQINFVLYLILAFAENNPRHEHTYVLYTIGLSNWKQEQDSSLFALLVCRL